MRTCPLCHKPIFKGQAKKMVMTGRHKIRGAVVHTPCLLKWKEEKEEKRGSRESSDRLDIIRARDMLIKASAEEVGKRIEVVKGR